MKKIRIIKIKKQINDALNIRNKSITNHFHDLSLKFENLDMKKKISNPSSKWIESFNFLNMKNEICKIEMLYDFFEFKNTIIKLYYRVNIEDNKNTNIVSNNKQMLSDEKKSSNDKKKPSISFWNFKTQKSARLRPARLSWAQVRLTRLRLAFLIGRNQKRLFNHHR